MSIEFNRRTFLKTSAALIGGGVLLGLTGCDSSSAHSIDKRVDLVGNESFTLSDALEISPFAQISDGSGTGNYVSIMLSISNLTNNDITLNSKNASAVGNGNRLPLLSMNTPTNPVTSVTIQKKATEASGTIYFSVPADFKTSDAIIKLHYGNQSIKFQNKGSELYTSGVYKD